jgi:uncharacterized membrane protein YphA (DoxX/SURF4 family)
MNIRNFDLDPQTLGKLPPLQRGAGRDALRVYERIDGSVVGFLREHAIVALRLALAAVFIWFGALKVAGRSPVYDLVADTVSFLPGSFVVPAFGVLEIAIGAGLLLGVGLRVVLLLFLLQMAGTFLVFVTQPGESFQDGNPLLLTTTGEFVLKNVVLIAAGLAVGATVARSRDQTPGSGAVQPVRSHR